MTVLRAERLAARSSIKLVATSHSTLHVLGSSAIHLPSMRLSLQSAADDLREDASQQSAGTKGCLVEHVSQVCLTHWVSSKYS